jgi:hypothetical protein
MYLGYMKRGIEYMAMFALAIYFASFFIGWAPYMNIGFIGAIFLIFLPIIWLYQMFDSMHTVSHMKRLEIEYPEDDGFFIPGVANISNISNLDALKIFKKRGVVKAIAITIICLGIYVLLSNISNALSVRYYINEDVYRIKEIYVQTFNTIMRYIPSVVISLVLIIGGIKLLVGKKNKNDNGGGE